MNVNKEVDLVKDAKTLILSGSLSGEADYLTKEGYCEYLKIDRYSKFNSKLDNIFASIYVLFFLVKHLATVNRNDVIIVFGNTTAAAVLFLSKLRIIKAKKIIWWGIFFHSHAAIRLYRRLRFLFETERTVYVLFSEYEKRLYRDVLGKKTTVKVMQYGDWKESEPQFHEEEDFYFSGGYSNRHYLPIIKAFEKSNLKLVIVASKLNRELINLRTTENITILFDLDKDAFYHLLSRSKGVIIPLKYNSGASGQSVVINAMVRKKLIIINDNEVMKEYITDRYNGIVVQDLEKDLIDRLMEVEADSEMKDMYIQNSCHIFRENFSRGACIKKTLNVIEGIQESMR
jgi:glycosyltransferase involved in cell wall biosynthesis